MKKNNKSDFDRLFNKLGGRFDTDEHQKGTYLGDFLSVLRSAIEEEASNHANPPHVYIDVINSPWVNAAAGKLDSDTYFIGINIGTIICLDGIFSTIMCQQDALPYIGQADRERNAPRFKDAHLTDLRLMFHQIEAEKFATPVCEVRYSFSQVLTMFALLSLCMHEYSHILNGHLDLILSKKKGSVSLDYNQVYENETLDALTYQTMEMDADMGSASICLDYIDRHFPGPIFGKVVFNDPLNAYYYWYFSFYASHRLFALDYQGLLQKHPPSGLRQIMILELVCEMYQRSEATKEKIEKAREILGNCMNQVEVAFALVSGSEIDNSALIEATSVNCQNQIEKYLHRWASLRPELSKFAFVRLAPVQERFRDSETKI